VRSENEIRAAIIELEKPQFDVGAPFEESFLADRGIMTYMLRWTIGEERASPKEMIIKSLKKEENRGQV